MYIINKQTDSGECEMKKKKIGVNAILNIVKQSLSVLFPFITYPYALRTLGAESIGKVNFASSIIGYFALIAMLGISTYAVREGAKRKNNKKEFEKFTNEIFTMNIIFTLVAYILLAITVILVEKFHNYALLIALQSISIVLTTLGVDWINTVYEDYLLITVRSIISYIITLGILFIFVHSPEDYYIYALLAVASNGVTCLINWFYCRKYVKIRITLHPNFSKHMKPLLILFANAVAISIYVSFDTTMLGWMKDDYSVGLYSVSVKIYTIVKNIMVAVYMVAIPRLAYYIGNKLISDYKKLYSDIWGYLILLLVPSSIGLMCISREIMLFMGGSEYLEATLALQILSVALIFAILGGLVTACLNITIGREKDNMKATIISAILNFGLNLIFIPYFNFYGAAFTTLVSEIFVFVFCFRRVQNKQEYLDFEIVKTSLKHALVASFIIILFTIFVKCIVIDSMERIYIIIPGSILLYALILLALKNKYFITNIEKFKKSLKNRFFVNWCR